MKKLLFLVALLLIVGLAMWLSRLESQRIRQLPPHYQHDYAIGSLFG